MQKNALIFFLNSVKEMHFFSLVLAILFQGNPQNFSVKLYTVGNSDRYM